MRIHRAIPLTVLSVLLLGCGGTETEEAEAVGEATADRMADDPDIAPTGETTGLPAGYALRLDRADADASGFLVETAGEGYHIRTGPAGIFYSDDMTVESGDYTLTATFTEIEAPPNHREAFGLFIGGSDLQGDGQRYTYFLVRADGKFLVKRRMGTETPEVSAGWVDSDAVNRAAGDADVTNELTVHVEGDAVHFMVNGTMVAEYPAADLDVYGVTGARINHNLNVEISGLQLTAG